MHGRREKRSSEINRKVNVRSGEEGVADCFPVVVSVWVFLFFPLLGLYYYSLANPDVRSRGGAHCSLFLRC